MFPQRLQTAINYLLLYLIPPGRPTVLQVIGGMMGYESCVLLRWGLRGIVQRWKAAVETCILQFAGFECFVMVNEFLIAFEAENMDE